MSIPIQVKPSHVIPKFVWEGTGRAISTRDYPVLRRIFIDGEFGKLLAREEVRSFISAGNYEGLKTVQAAALMKETEVSSVARRICHELMSEAERRLGKGNVDGATEIFEKITGIMGEHGLVYQKDEELVTRFCALARSINEQFSKTH